MSIPVILGTPAEDNDNNPVEVRGYQIEGGPLDAILGYYPSSPIYHDEGLPSPQHYWRYYPNGMIVSSVDTCAHVLYGPILDYYAAVGQFKGSLGAPSSDITQMPDGTSYATFVNGVVYVDSQGYVEELTPVPTGMVISLGQIDPTPSGIAGFAQMQIETLAVQKIGANPSMFSQVRNLTTSVQFESVGSGGCTGASFSASGTSLLRSHVMRVNFEFFLNGCAGVFGNAFANMHVTVRVHFTQATETLPAKISGFLEGYTIDAVSSPFDAGDNDIRSGLSQAFNGQFGTDLINRPIATQLTLVALLVDPTGQVNAYIEPGSCTTSALVRNSSTPQASESTIGQLRQLRDQYLLHSSHGKEFSQIVSIFGATLAGAIRGETDAAQLRESLSRFLVANFHQRADLKKLAKNIDQPMRKTVDLLHSIARKRDVNAMDRLLPKAVQFVRKELSGTADFQVVMKSLSRFLDEEKKQVVKKRASH